MTRFTDRVTRDLHQIADRSTPSSTAWESIRTRIDEQTDQPTSEVIMLSPNRNTESKRGWMLAAAAAAGLVLIGGLVFATTRADDDIVPADTPVVTLPVEPAPDAEVDPDAEAVVVPAPEPTTAAEVTPEPEPLPEPVTVIVTGTYSDSDAAAATTPMPSSAGLIGDTTFLGTTNFAGAFAGSAPFVSQTWNLPDGSQFATGEFVFTGAVEGLGSGTLSFVDLPEVVDGVWSSTATITGGTGDFEGAFGTGVFTANAADPGNGGAGTYSWTITVPPKDSLETVTATGTAGYQGGFRQGDQPGEYVGTFRHIFKGSMVGEGPSEGTLWDIADGQLGVLTMEFTGTIDGLGTGTMTMLEIYTQESGNYETSVTVTGGTGDFEGITGTGTWFQTTPAEYTFELTAPVNQ